MMFLISLIIWFLQKVQINLNFIEQVEEWYVDLALAIYKALEKEYEFLTSREAIEERIEVNDYEFYEDGSLA